MKGENCLAVFNLGHLDYSIALVACSATLVCRDHLSVLSADTIFLHLEGRMFLKIKEGDQE